MFAKILLLFLNHDFQKKERPDAAKMLEFQFLKKAIDLKSMRDVLCKIFLTQNLMGSGALLY